MKKRGIFTSLGFPMLPFRSLILFKLLIYLVGSHVISGKMYSEAVVTANTTPSGRFKQGSYRFLQVKFKSFEELFKTIYIIY